MNSRVEEEIGLAETGESPDEMANVRAAVEAARNLLCMHVPVSTTGTIDLSNRRTLAWVALRFAQAHLEFEEEEFDESCEQHRPVGQQLLKIAREMEIYLKGQRETMQWATDQILEKSMEEKVEFFGRIMPNDSANWSFERKDEYIDVFAREFSANASPELRDIIYMAVKQALQRVELAPQHETSNKLP